jgi:hypothetical protein
VAGKICRTSIVRQAICALALFVHHSGLVSLKSKGSPSFATLVVRKPRTCSHTTNLFPKQPKDDREKLEIFCNTIANDLKKPWFLISTESGSLLCISGERVMAAFPW